MRPCGVPGCERKHLARGFCRNHYYKDRRDRGIDDRKNCRVDSPVRVAVLMSTASLHGAYFPKLKPVKVRITVGVMVECPACASWMTAASPTRRACRSCGTTVTLNGEEVSWLISEERSRRASRRIAS